MYEHPAVRAAEGVLWEHDTEKRYDETTVEASESYRHAMVANGAVECTRCGAITTFEDVECYGGAACSRCINDAGNEC